MALAFTPIATLINQLAAFTFAFAFRPMEAPQYLHAFPIFVAFAYRIPYMES